MTTLDHSTLAGNRYAYFHGACSAMATASRTGDADDLIHARRLIGFTVDAHNAAGENDILADVLNDLIFHAEKLNGAPISAEVRALIDAELPAAPVDPAPAAADVDTESRIVAEKVRREVFGDWSPWTVYPERDERYGWTVTRTRGNERQLFMRSSDDWLVAARIACELNWNEGLRPECIDTGRAHGPAIVDLLAARDGLQLPTPAEASAWWAEMSRRNPWTTPAAIIADVPQTVIAEDGAAFLAAHDRKQAARKLANRLTVKPSPAGTCFNVYDGRDKIANLARYQTFNNRWFYDAHGCPSDGFATSTEALEHLAARHFAQPAHTHDLSRPATLPQLMACPACCAPQPGDIEWSLD